MNSVAYVTTTFPTLASFIEDEVHRLRRRGVRVRVFTLRAVSREYQPEHQPLLEITESLGSPLDPRGWWALLGWMLRRPHVVVSEAAQWLWASRRSGYALAGHLAYLPAAARIASRLKSERFERVHGAWAHFPASVASLAARLAGVRFSMAAHAGSDLYRTQAFLAEKVRRADFTTACVRGNAEMLRRLAGPGARVAWIYHGVDLERFDRGRGVRDPDPLLVAVGRLSPPKGFDLALRAFARLDAPAARLVLVGDGPERERLEALARELAIESRVEFLGACHRDQVIDLYRRAWLLLAPSRVLSNGRRDGIPNVVIEAMAMGVPCVGTRAAGLEEAIVPGETGALAPPEDPLALAAAIEGLLRDPKALERMGERARLRVASEFDAAANFERLLDLFEDRPASRGAVFEEASA